ncbi:MAG: hypothetical protein O7G85_03450 [Planctomycetota bacterium]|nr:hypothetical protein [Planctomycetota bacterium]
MIRKRWLQMMVLAPAYVAMMVVATAVIGVLIVRDWDHQLGFVVTVLQVLGDSDWWRTMGIVCTVGAVLQILFLIPIFQRNPPRGERSRSLSVSLALGAIVSAILVMGLALGLIDALSLVAPDQFDLEDKHPALWVFVGLALFLSWGFWSICLLLFTRGIWADRVLGRLVGLLLAGTALELLVVLPIEVMVKRRTDCHCVTGSFLALCVAGAMALWLVGPGIAIALCAKKHRRWRLTHCGVCGYPMGPTPGPVCPECGFAWKQSKPAKKGG